MHTKTYKFQRKLTNPVIFAVLGSLMIANIVAPITNAITPIVCATSEVNIVAHQDDDILFMNPDIAESILLKRCIITVYLTAGEWNGTSTMSREAYADARNKGARAAYARMANVANVWTPKYTSTFNGQNILNETLDGAPNIKHIYINIPDGGDSNTPLSLESMYKNPQVMAQTIQSLILPGYVTPIRYGKDYLISTLLNILIQCQATVIRTQDYLPDQHLFGNHTDHVYGALFAVAAARAYQGINNNLHTNLVTYRDYDILNSPVNIGAVQTAQKNSVINAYKAYDPIFALPADQSVLASRMYYRWPVAPTWVAANKDGTLQAFDIQSGQLVTWRQNTNGTWGNMQSLGNSSLQPGIGIGMNPDGTLQVFVVKQTISGTGVVQQDLQYIKQTTANGGFSPSSWVTLANPGVSTKGMYDISSPSVVANADGRLEVFLKDSNNNLATIVQQAPPTGGYSDWIGLGGNNNLMETPATLLRTDGRIEIYSATRGNVYHWMQRSPNDSVVFDTAFGAAAQAVGTPSAGFNQDGRPEIFYRRAGDGTVYTAVQTVSGSWSPAEFNLGSKSSQGAPAVANTKPVLTTGSLVRLVSRTPTIFETTNQIADNSSFALPWTSIGSYTQHAPASILDSQNRVHSLIISQDGILSDITSIY